MQKLILSRKYFKLAFILYAFINTLALGYLGIENHVLAIIIIIWALIIFINDIIHKEITINKDFILINSYGIILFLATICNQEYSDFKSYLIAIMQLIIFSLIFSNKKNTTITSIKEELRSIIPFTNLLVGIASGISLIMYLLNIYDTKNNWLIGVSGNRLFGIYFNCNPAAFLACITILLAILAIAYNYKYKKIYYFNIMIQTVYLLLTKCRSALIILAIIITALIYCFFIKKKNYLKIKKFFILCSICILIIFGSLLIDRGISIIFNNQAGPQEENRFQLEKIFEASKSLLTGDSSKAIELIDQVSSGRLELLNTSIEVWRISPIIGIGANNFRKMGIAKTNGTTVQGIQVVHSHNEFIESLVTTGVIGFLLYFVFFITCLKKVIKLLNFRNCKKYYFSILIFCLIVLSEVIGGFFDYGVFYTYSLSTIIAWNFLGYLDWFYLQENLI